MERAGDTPSPSRFARHLSPSKGERKRAGVAAGLSSPFRITLVAAVLALATPSTALAADRPPVEAVEVAARPVAHFRFGSQETRFGPLTFAGGLEMTARHPAFGGFSSFRFLTPGGRFAGVADTGHWFFGRILRDAGGRPSGVADFTLQAMVDADGSASGEKWQTDAEAIAVSGDIATVGFERRHRIAEFRLDPAGMGGALRTLDFLVPAHELRMNRGFETIARAPADGPLEGARVAVTEKSLDRHGNRFAAILEGPLKGVFTVADGGRFDITDGAFLPGGDLLLLERSFSMLEGVGMRLRRIEGKSIRPGAVVDGPVILTADMGYQIDNMEGLDVWRRGDGALMVSLLSDDNTSFLQRNLYLEFRLDE